MLIRVDPDPNHYLLTTKLIMFPLGSMALAAGIEAEAVLSLRHAERVMEAMQSQVRSLLRPLRQNK